MLQLTKPKINALAPPTCNALIEVHILGIVLPSFLHICNFRVLSKMFLLYKIGFKYMLYNFNF